jgi:hypothetical protein
MAFIIYSVLASSEASLLINLYCQYKCIDCTYFLVVEPKGSPPLNSKTAVGHFF